MAELMSGFPALPEGQVTLSNWRTPPFNRWAFHHVREILPTAEIPNDPWAVWQLPSEPEDFDHLEIEQADGSRLRFDAFLETGAVSGMVVLHQGRLVYEAYANGLGAYAPHILMSVSKSLLGVLMGILMARGLIDGDSLVTDHIPELEASAYRGARLRDLLDMRVGVAFGEDYEALSGPIIDYRKATNWNPLDPGEAPGDLRSFFSTLTASDGAHGGRNHYVSPNTDLIGWIIERTTGMRYVDLMSHHLWQPMGAERSAYVTLDRLGAPRVAGGMCATVRDLARLGQLLVQDGRRGARQVVPAEWIADLETGGSAEAWAGSALAESYPGREIRYRSKWYAHGGDRPMLFAVGIHGQNLFVDCRREIVIAKVAAQPRAHDDAQLDLALRAADAIRKELAGHAVDREAMLVREL
jgi:CubicO group peptidase (beta-lactamase class C family)